MTPAEFKAIRNKAGLSANKLAKLLRLSDGRVIRMYEAGDRPISGPIAKIMEGLRDSMITGDWPEGIWLQEKQHGD